MDVLVRSLFFGVMVCLGVFATSRKEEAITGGLNKPTLTANVAWLSIGITGPHRGVSMAPVTDEDTTVKTYIKRHQP